jgi:hypothetical protein
MTIDLIRAYNCATYCIGHLYVDGKYVCDTIEDTDRGLDKNMPLAELQRRKVKSQTAIPTGTYKVTLGVVSPKFSQKPYYMKFCGGRVPRLLDVPAYEGILIHIGSTEKSSAGCLIVGYNTIKGRVTNSQTAFEKLYSMMRGAKGNIYIDITRKYKV